MDVGTKRTSVQRTSVQRTSAQGTAVLGLTLLGTLALGSCSINVPDPGASQQPLTASSAIATPSITPGHDADAVAGKDLPLSAGDTLQGGVPVGISDGLKDAQGWKIERINVQGENRYGKTDGCTVATRVLTNQGSLSVDGNDKASTAALFQYLDPSILPEYLRVETLPWGGGHEESAHQAEVLALEGNPNAGQRATAIFARLFSKAGSSVYISVSCPDGDKLGAAKADVAAHLTLIPPSA